ncbi:fused MFS/spermidine synthase [bacterium]|nr:fused MFS/spermidine synthase [bacterium]
MPLLFAVTLFVSASLLFMVQPMVGKMILPLLGGSPAVWNACMVFFQVLLLLGYLYAHWMSTRYDPKQQGKLHTLVLAAPIAAFAFSAALGVRGTPIAIVDGLAPTDGANPFLAVLALLAVAIGIPFFVASTSAPLLQRWFSFTGHPSSRDPYFLYAASNVGSLVSLLGYPLFIEPNMTIAQQAWFFAVGFAVLAVLIVACGRAAANPIGVPPAGKGGDGGGGAAKRPGAVDVVTEPAPSPLRVAKWVLLAFVPSSLMLAVTFHMSTDIASIPLLWVIPLALYLVTFIISFSTLVPPWFRVVLGNLAPIMLLLLVFVMCAPHLVSVAPTLAIHITAFFFAALMCHYELARDRPKDVSHLTAYFLWMSVGGMLGGMFNGIFAPLVFTYAHEYPVTIVVACGMVPVFASQTGRIKGRLFPGLSGPRGEAAEWLATAGIALAVFGVCLAFCYVVVGALFDMKYWYVVALIPAWAVLWQWRVLRTREYPETDNPEELPLAKLSKTAKKTDFRIALDVAVPVTLGVIFWLLTVWEEGAYQQGSSYAKMVKSLASNITILSEQVAGALLIYALPVMACFFFVDRPVRFALCVAAILGIHYYRESLNERIVYTDRSFFGILKVEQDIYRAQTRLVHGTTLHGTQFNEHWHLHKADVPIVLGSFSPWDSLAINGALVKWDARQEPLTYYHRTGPVGAMFYEIRTRALAQGRDPAKDDVAMVGLGTGSAACYALKGQRLTFYEIDPAVRRIVEEPWMVMNKEEVAEGAAPLLGPITYVKAARDRGAKIDFQMGDARLKLRDDVDRKYSLLLVDAFSSDAIPVHLLTKQAVEMYMERLTPDGILALHISNKYVRLEPVVAGIAKELKLASRVWNDDSESRPGKTASSWCVLARKEADLGELGKSAVEQAKSFGTRSEPLVYLLNKYGPDKNAMEAILAEWGGPEGERNKLTPSLMSVREGPQAAILYQYAIRLRDAGRTGSEATLGKLAEVIFGQMYHPLRVLDQVPLWTDDYSDVLRVIMIKEVQRVRRAFGLPTPVTE